MTSSSDVGTLVVGAFTAPPAIAPPPRQKKLPKMLLVTELIWHGNMALLILIIQEKSNASIVKKKVTRGVYMLKHHLAGTQKDVEACKTVPDEIKREICKFVQDYKKILLKR